MRKKRLQILPYHQSSDHQEGGAGFPTFNFAGFEAFSSQIRNIRHPTVPSDSIEEALAPIKDDQVQTGIFDSDHNFGDFMKTHSMKKTVSEELNERPRSSGEVEIQKIEEIEDDNGMIFYIIY